MTLTDAIRELIDQGVTYICVAQRSHDWEAAVAYGQEFTIRSDRDPLLALLSAAGISRVDWCPLSRALAACLTRHRHRQFHMWPCSRGWQANVKRPDGVAWGVEIDADPIIAMSRAISPPAARGGDLFGPLEDWEYV